MTLLALLVSCSKDDTEIQELPLGAPELSTPENDNFSVSLNEKLSWKPIATPDQNGPTITYTILLGTNTTDFSPIVRNIISTSSKLPDTLSPNRSYFWKITAHLEERSSTSEIRRFKISESGFASPTLIAPTNKAIVTSNETLRWSAAFVDHPSIAKTTYNTYLGNDRDNLTLIKENSTETSMALPADLKVYTNYYWKVVANKGDLTADSEIFEFTTTPLENIYHGSISLKSQQELDDFFTEKYTKINGDLHIGAALLPNQEPSDITSLAKLEFISTIEGDLIIHKCPNLRSLTGLQNITRTKQNLIIEDNAIENLQGLNSLELVGGNASLESKALIGIEKLKSVGGNLSIRRTEAVSLTALENLEFIGGELSISAKNITNLEGIHNVKQMKSFYLWNAENLTSLNGFPQAIYQLSKLSIGDVPKLTSLSGLGNIEYINKEFLLYQLPELNTFNGIEQLEYASAFKLLQLNKLTQIGAESLPNLNGNSSMELHLVDCPNLTLVNLRDIKYFRTFYISNTGLKNLNGFSPLEIFDALSISENEHLENLSGLQKISKLKMGLRIWKNPKLNSLTALENLEKIGTELAPSARALTIQHNGELTNLDGFENLNEVGGQILISNNSILAGFCALQNLLHTNGQPEGDTSISGNAYNPSLDDIKNNNCQKP